MSIAQIREAAGTAAGIAKISDEKILPQSARAVGHLTQPRYESPIARKIQKHRIPDDLPAHRLLSTRIERADIREHCAGSTSSRRGNNRRVRSAPSTFSSSWATTNRPEEDRMLTRWKPKNANGSPLRD